MMSGSSQGEQFEPAERAVTAWIMAVLAGAASAWVGWMLGWPLILDYGDPEFNPVILLLGLLLAVCAGNIFQALRWQARARQFGSSQIEIEGRPPILLGTRFSGQVRTGRPVQTAGDFRLVLTCHDLHERRNAGNSDGGTPHRSESFPVWSAELSLPGATDSAKGLRFGFDLPASVGPKPLPPIRPAPSPYFRGSLSINIPGLRRIFTRNSPPVARYWTLVVTAPTPGPDFRAEFTVPLADH